MPRQRLYIFAVIAAVVALLGYQGYQYARPGQGDNSQASSINDSDPFADMSLPSGLDQATEAAMQYHIDTAKAIYAKTPGAWEAWIAIGNAYRLVKDYDRAILAYQKSLELQANNILGHRNLAEVYNMDLKDYEKAVAHYRLAIDNQFGDPELYITLAQVYGRKMNEPEKAEQVYIEGYRSTGFNARVLVELIEFYKYTDNDEKYRENVRLLLEQNPDNEQYKKAYGSIK